MIEHYFQRIENTISRFESIQSYSLNKRFVSDFFGIIKGSIRFTFGILDFLEVVRMADDGNPLKKKFKYHFRDKSNKMIFRYDNVPHYPDISTFPIHKHVGNEVEECNEPDLYHVLMEIEDKI
jgi:hypothetical protein